MNQSAFNDPTELRAAWTALQQEQPTLRIRDAAQKLGVSEAELLATGVGSNITRLNEEFGEMVMQLPTLGEIMALTRNESAVHERKGTYRNVSVDGKMGLVLDEEIDLRLFLMHWHSGFAVEENIKGEPRLSLHFFDNTGTAVHKVYLQPEGSTEAYRAFVEQFRAAEQVPGLAVEPVVPATDTLPDNEVDFQGLYEGWRALEDTHQFFGLLRRFKVDRVSAMRNAPHDLAIEVDGSALRRVLNDASASELPIMIFVGSRGVIQIHTGPVSRIVPMEPWINVLDPRFNLHLREDHIASAWIVRKPTTDGVVTALEVFDADGGIIATLFGKRKPGNPELTAWQELIATVEADHVLERAA